MAGSYKHCVTDSGELLEWSQFVDMIENLGDAFEAVEEMHWMIRYLANGDQAKIKEALDAFYKNKRLPDTRSPTQQEKSR